MKLKLLELQELNKKVQKTRTAKELQEGYKEVDKVLHYQGLPFVSEIIQTELISQYHNNPLSKDFSINKTRKLISRKYYWSSLTKDVEAYVKGCNVCLSLKAVKHKPYSKSKALPIPTHWWKDLLIDFVTGLSTLDTLRLVEDILDMVV